MLERVTRSCKGTFPELMTDPPMAPATQHMLAKGVPCQHTLGPQVGSSGTADTPSSLFKTHLIVNFLGSPESQPTAICYFQFGPAEKGDGRGIEMCIYFYV